MGSKNRLFSKFIRQINDDLTITSNALGDNASTGSGVTINSTLDSLGDVSGLEAGSLRYISGANRLFVWSGSAWETIELTNNPPTFDAGGLADSDYTLSRDGTPVIINLAATDPEGVPLTWTYEVTDGTMANVATLQQDSSVFTITPSTGAGQFQLTFTGSDGKNDINSISNFTLAPPVQPGEQIYTSGTNTFTVPDGVFNLSVVCVGGGGAGVYNWTPQSNGGASSFGISGQDFYFYAGGGTRGGVNNESTGGAGGTRGGAYDGGGNGGLGSNGSYKSGGGGAGGYSGNGGRSNGCSRPGAGGLGGGVGIFGQGANGAAGSTAIGAAYAGSGGGGGAGGSCQDTSCGSSINGGAGSGGQAYGPTNVNQEYKQQAYGGGGRSTQGGGGGGGALAYKNNIAVTPGQQITVSVGSGGSGTGGTSGGGGAVRIVWPAYEAATGLVREFPTTNVGPSADL